MACDFLRDDALQDAENRASAAEAKSASIEAIEAQIAKVEARCQRLDDCLTTEQVENVHVERDLDTTLRLYSRVAAEFGNLDIHSASFHEDLECIRRGVNVDQVYIHRLNTHYNFN